jgi:DNA-binding response OmpR family regulator
VIRRKRFDGNKTITISEITITPEERSLKVNNEFVSLTAKEFDLLLFFITSKTGLSRITQSLNICWVMIATKWTAMILFTFTEEILGEN